jgi:hypothetical protein
MRIVRIKCRRERNCREEAMLHFNRRQLLGETAAAGAAVAFGLDRALAAGLDLPKALPEGVRANAILDALPSKKPLIKLSDRPPNYETPIEYFRTAITPNRCVLRALPSLGHPRDRCQDLEAVGGR